MRIANGYIEVLECQECGFLGAIDLYHVENNSTSCPECGCIYLGYSQVLIKWYAKYKLAEEMVLKGLKEISPGMWVRK